MTESTTHSPEMAFHLRAAALNKEPKPLQARIIAPARKVFGGRVLFESRPWLEVRS
jgi:hypothetical protein